MPYAHDIFVSYAVRDNTPDERPWVTAFVEQLRNYLLQHLQRRDIKIWMDLSQLAGNDLLTPEITTAVRDTAAFVMFLSPQYNASTWCQQEVRTFLDHVPDLTRVFLIELHESVPRHEKLTDLRGYRLWGHESDNRTPRRLAYPEYDRDRDRDYFVLLNILANQLASCINRLQSPPDPLAANPTAVVAGAAVAGVVAGGAAAGAAGALAAGAIAAGAVAVGAVAASAAAANGASDKPTVFLAEPTDDLLVPCHELRSDLEQLGINVIPGFDVFYPREPDAFRAAVRADLAKASAFAQLLSGVAGRTPPGLPEGYVAAQHALAQEMGRQRSLPILQWRSPELTPATVAAPGHRKLLEGTTVIAAGLEEFKRLVAEEAAKAAQPPEEDDAVTVFCSADSVDLQGEHRQRIIEQLNRRNIVSFWLGDSKNPVSEYKKRLKESHAFLVLFGKSELMWVQDQLRHSYKYLPRDKPVGVIEGPPPPEKPADLGIVLPRVTVDVIDCRGGWNEAAFQSFLQKLPARARR